MRLVQAENVVAGQYILDRFNFYIVKTYRCRNGWCYLGLQHINTNYKLDRFFRVEDPVLVLDELDIEEWPNGP